MPPGDAHPRDKLSSLLWGSTVETTARTSLRQTLYSLRRSLRRAEGAPLHADGNMVWLDPDAVTLDVTEFEQRVHDGTPAALTEAIALYGGDLLDGRVGSFSARIASRAFSRRIVASGVTVQQGWSNLVRARCHEARRRLSSPEEPDGRQSETTRNWRERPDRRPESADQRRRRVAWLSGAPSSNRGSRAPRCRFSEWLGPGLSR
jgi:hypothetical protein